MKNYVIWSDKHWYIKRHINFNHLSCYYKPDRLEECFTSELEKARLFTIKSDLKTFQQELPECYGVSIEINPLVTKAFK